MPSHPHNVYYPYASIVGMDKAMGLGGRGGEEVSVEIIKMIGMGNGMLADFS